ncbi:MAG TPA: hypothetical protein VGU74_07750, partial [Gemmatimonadales bacterium]|nr:hypothetical protein [Gemmatimonadales bacterium]
MRRTHALGCFILAAVIGWGLGCHNPSDVPTNAMTQPSDRPHPDGTVKRLPLSDRPLALKVSPKGFAYIGQTDASQLTRLDLSTQTFGSTVAVGLIPSDVVFNSTSTRAYVSNQRSQSVGIIDVAANTQIDTI